MHADMNVKYEENIYRLKNDLYFLHLSDVCELRG